jgi:hypothetical protein
MYGLLTVLGVGGCLLYWLTTGGHLDTILQWIHSCNGYTPAMDTLLQWIRSIFDSSVSRNMAAEEGASGRAEQDDHLLSQMFMFEHEPVSGLQNETHCKEFTQLFGRFVERVRVAQMEKHDEEVSIHIRNTMFTYVSNMQLAIFTDAGDTLCQVCMCTCKHLKTTTTVAQ